MKMNEELVVGIQLVLNVKQSFHLIGSSVRGQRQQRQVEKI